jgi:Bacterial Ig-like domain (group 3)
VVSAAVPDPNPLDNSIAVMTSANGMLTAPSFLTAGQTNTLMFVAGWPRSESFSVNFASTLPGVTIDPASITIPSGQTSGTTTIRPGDAVTGWTTLSLQTPIANNPASMNVPVVLAGSQPQLDTAVMVGAWGEGTIYAGYLQPIEVPVSVLARRWDGVRPTGTISLIDPTGNVVQTQTLSASAAASFSLNGSDPGTYAYRTRYEGDANFRPVTVPYPSVTVARLQVNVTISIPAPACGVSDIIITVKSASSTTLAPPGSVSVIIGSSSPITVSLSPTGVAGESRGVLRHTLSSGSQSVSASYPGSTYFDSSSSYTWVTVTGICTPANLTATATAPNQVLLTWQGSGAQFEILRGQTMNTFGLIGVTSSSSFVDNSAASGKTYLYKVRSLDASGAPSPYSAIDLATTIMMTDNPVVSRSTVIKAAHILELRLAVNAVRAAAGLAAQTFEALGSGSPLRAVDITSLRTALGQARDALSMPLAAFTDSSLTGVPMKAIHIEELRNGVR